MRGTQHAHRNDEHLDEFQKRRKGRWHKFSHCQPKLLQPKKNNSLKSICTEKVNNFKVYNRYTIELY